MRKIRPLIYILTLLLASCWNLKAAAQQTIIQVPSSEILAPGELFVKESNRFKPFGENKFVTISPSVTAGIGFNSEISGGVATSIADDTVVRGDFAAKKAFLITGNTRFTVGTRINPYLADSVTPDNFTYAHLSTRIRKTRTSFTAGAFVASQRGEILPDRPGALVGIEQSLIGNKLRLAVDWISRNESYGLLGVGLKYRPAPTISVTGAVLIPNGNNGRFAFLISASKYFSLNNKRTGK